MAVPTRPRRKLVIDTDPGIDDALAVLLALASPELDVLAVTTVFGNATVATTTHNALKLLALAGRPQLPVATGAAASLTGQLPQAIPHIHGQDGMGDSTALPHPQAGARADITAAQLMVQLARQHPGELSVLTLGPLTNLALALALDPGLPQLVREVVVMGGNAHVPGNTTPAAEANILGDPEAADRVLGAAWPLTLVGLDVTRPMVLPGKEVDRLAGSEGAAGALCRHAVPHYRRFFGRTYGIDGIRLHDPTAAACLIEPGLFETSAWPVRVETQGISRGKTWPCTGPTDTAPQPWRGRPAVKVCTGVDVDGVLALVMSRLAG